MVLAGTVAAHATILSYVGLPADQFARMFVVQAIVFWPIGTIILAGFDLPSAIRIPASVPIGLIASSVGVWTLSYVAGISAAFLVSGILAAICAWRSRRVIASFAVAKSETVAALCLVSLFALLVGVVPTAGDSCPNSTGAVRFTTTDSIALLAITKLSLHSPRPTVPNYSGPRLAYHFLYPWYMAALSRASAVSPEVVVGYWHRYLAVMMLTAVAFTAVLAITGSRVWAMAGVIMLVGAQGLNIAWYWILEFLAYPPPVLFFIPHQGARQGVLIAQFGNAAFISAVLALLLVRRPEMKTSQGVLIGALIGAGALFHLSLAAHATVILVLDLFVMWRSNERNSVLAMAAVSGSIIAALALGGVISSSGGASWLAPTMQSATGQFSRFMITAKWLGIECIAAAALIILRPGREWSAFFRFSTWALLTWPVFMLLYNGTAPFYSNYWFTLASFLAPIVTVAMIKSWMVPGARLRWLALSAMFLWSFQLAGGIINQVGVARTGGSRIDYDVETILPLRELERRTSSPEDVVLSNTTEISFEKSSDIWYIFLPAIVGKPCFLETSHSGIFSVSERDEFRLRREFVHQAFVTDDAVWFLGQCRRNGIRYVVEHAAGPRLSRNVRDVLRPIASSTRIAVFEIIPG